jgi:hypothetical protein
MCDDLGAEMRNLAARASTARTSKRRDGAPLRMSGSPAEVTSTSINRGTLRHWSPLRTDPRHAPSGEGLAGLVADHTASIG